jgi:SAM-dependent methyltransferase
MAENNKKSSIIHDIVHKCHICGNPHLDIFKKYSRFHRVTSDCKPWVRGGTLAVCLSCGCVQKLIDAAWQSETDQIYREYTIYYQSGGEEQATFEQESGFSSSRSLKILNSVHSLLSLPDYGMELDIGCGNGALLRHFNQIFPQWNLYGTELNDKYKKIVESIPNVESLYICDDPEHLKNTFDCITMIHVLEHIIHPQKFLETICGKLNDRGVLIIEVPFFKKNPYDLLIADHCTHFTEKTLSVLLKKSGFKIFYTSTEWVPKELTIIAVKNLNGEDEAISLKKDNLRKEVLTCIEWLDSNINDSATLAKLGVFGIFGTSIAASWLFSEMQGEVAFFVDEDPNRIGKMHLGCPIYHPKNVPENSFVFIPFCPEQANKIKTRLAAHPSDVHFVVPSKLCGE